MNCVCWTLPIILIKNLKSLMYWIWATSAYCAAQSLANTVHSNTTHEDDHCVLRLCGLFSRVINVLFHTFIEWLPKDVTNINNILGPRSDPENIPNGGRRQKQVPSAPKAPGIVFPIRYRLAILYSRRAVSQNSLVGWRSRLAQGVVLTE
jgi:hypothetical protein